MFFLISKSFGEKDFFLLNKFLNVRAREDFMVEVAASPDDFPLALPARARQTGSHLCGWTWSTARGHLKCWSGTPVTLSCPLAPGCFLFCLIPAYFVLPDECCRRL